MSDVKDRREAFRAMWEAMPKDWQFGLEVAREGGAWSGELLNTDGSVGAVVFFVHPSQAEPVEKLLREMP